MSYQPIFGDTRCPNCQNLRFCTGLCKSASASRFSLNTNKSSATKSSTSKTQLPTFRTENVKTRVLTGCMSNNVGNNENQITIMGMENQYGQRSGMKNVKRKYTHHNATKTKPFNQYCSEIPKLFTAPPPPPPTNKGQVKTIRNYQMGTKRDFNVVPQGMELYQGGHCDSRTISQEDFEKLVDKVWQAAAFESSQPKFRECTQLNQPKFNTLRDSIKNIQFAIGNLKFLPVEMEKYVKTDPMLCQRIEQAVTKKLNVSLKSSIYKDLVSTEAPTAERLKSIQDFQKEILAIQPLPKHKDSEPNILDFNTPQFSRIKPKIPDPPLKPQIQNVAVSSEMTDDFLLLHQEKEFSSLGEKDSNASLISPISAINLQKSSKPTSNIANSSTFIKSVKLTKQ